LVSFGHFIEKVHAPGELAEWLSGAVCSHDAAYFAALDIVARSHFFTRRIKKITSRAKVTKVTP
jgi:hypothetical protein